MANPAAREGEQADGNMPHSRPESGAAGASASPRRGSADSFRELLARLKKSNEQVQEELADRSVAASAPAAIPVEPVVAAASAEPVAARVDAGPPPAIVIAPKADWLPPEPPPAPEPVAAYEPPPPPPPPVVDAQEQERRARMRAEAHAASQEIIARLRKAASQAEKKEKPPELVEPLEPVASEVSVPQTPVAEALNIPAPTPVEEATVAEAAPVVVAAPVAEAEPLSAAPQGRRRHPFFPDVFLDDDQPLASPPPEEPAAQGTPWQKPDTAPVEPDTAPVEEATLLAEVMPVELPEQEDFAELPQGSPVPETVYLHQPQGPAEAAPELHQPPADPEPAVAEASAFEVPAQPADAEQAGEDGHQEELIEDEADAVRHLRGVEVKGIGDIARAVFSAPTPGDRAEFLAAVRQVEPGLSAPEVMAADEATLARPPVTVRRVAPADDPFAKIAPDAAAHVNHDEPDEDSGELARSLLDMMLSSPSAGLPQERALAADALLKLIPKVPTKALISIAERLAMMDSPPNLLIAKMINDPRIEIAGPLLEQCNHISDQVLGKVIATGQISLQRLIARRRHLSAALTDQLIEFDDASVLLTLVRNSGAVISHASFDKLMQHAKSHSDALAPLATRSDLPPPVAFELFWFVPAELRRYLLSRFLTDSETLTKILKITKVMQGGEGSESQFADQPAVDAFMAALLQGRREEAVQMLAAMSGISADCAFRIIGDRQGEPLAVVFKAIGLTRAQFEDYVGKLQRPEVGVISAERVVLELQSTFNSMSFNKARILLTYWDWAVLKHGPYAEPH